MTILPRLSLRRCLIGCAFFLAAGWTVLLAEAQNKPSAKPAVKKAVAHKAAQQSPSKKQTESPNAQLKAMVEQTLAKNPYYSPGQLISRGDADQIFQKLRELNWMTAENQEGLGGSLLGEQSFLVTRLKTPAGRAFMKQIAADPTAFDRLERLSWTVDGRRLIDSFVNSKDGASKFQQLKTPEQLAKVSKQFAADPRTPEFALPTGHVHRAADLVKQLEEVLAAQNSAE